MADTTAQENDNAVDLVAVDEQELVLTTKDNPYNPKTEYEKWRQWDVDNGYHTEEYLARITVSNNQVDIDDEIELNKLTSAAVHEILEHDVLNIYILV